MNDWLVCEYAPVLSTVAPSPAEAAAVLQALGWVVRRVALPTNQRLDLCRDARVDGLVRQGRAGRGPWVGHTGLCAVA